MASRIRLAAALTTFSAAASEAEVPIGRAGIEKATEVVVVLM